MTAPLAQANPHTLKRGDIVFFRNAGTGTPALARVESRGPLNQFRITFVDDNGTDLPGGGVAVNEHRELWQEATR